MSQAQDVETGREVKVETGRPLTRRLVEELNGLKCSKNIKNKIQNIK